MSNLLLLWSRPEPQQHSGENIHTVIARRRNERIVLDKLFFNRRFRFNWRLFFNPLLRLFEIVIGLGVQGTNLLGRLNNVVVVFVVVPTIGAERFLVRPLDFYAMKNG